MVNIMMVAGWALVVLAVVRSHARTARNLKGKVRGYGGCFRCGDRWDWKESHVTEFYDDRHVSESCSPLCEECWAALTPETRLPYYEEMLAIWELAVSARQQVYLEAFGEPNKGDLIRAAVMAGK